MQNQRSWQVQTYDVFVGNLPLDTDQKKVSKYFTKFGEVHAVIVRDSNTDGKKLAYVKFLCLEDAEKAVAECQNIDINGTKVVVRKAEPRKKPGPDRFNKDDGGIKSKGPYGQKSDQGSASSNQSKDLLEEMVMVTHVESANSLWAQIVTEDNMQHLLNMTEQLQTLCAAASKITGVPEQNKIYGAQFSEDQQWYRCRVKQSFGTDRVKVLYIDYGNTEELNPSSLVDIPANISSVKPFAVRLIFNNIRVTETYDKKAINYLKQTTEGKYIRSVMKRKLADQTGYFAEMFVEGECLNDKMVEEGYASHRLEMKRREMDGNTRGGGGFGTPTERDVGGGYSVNADKASGDFVQRQVYDETGKIQVSLPNSGRSTPNSETNHVNSGQDLRAELNAKIQELQKVKYEKEKINGELANLRSRMKVLQNEFASVSNKMLETSVNNQFRIVLELAGKVRKLRCQFPVLQKTPIDDGLDLVNSEERIQNTSVKSLPEVLTALSKYRGAQKDICMLKDMSTLDSLVEARNSAREETVAILRVCVEELEALPLTERGKAVQATLAKIRKFYDSYFKFVVHSCPSLETFLPTFVEWKQKRMTEFSEARKMTDSYKDAAMTALASIKSQLSFDNLESTEQTDYDLEALLRQYIQGLQHEITVTDAERTSEGAFLAALVQSLYTELQSEMTNIDNYQHLLTEFRSMKTECEPWLHDKPCTEELLGIRKTLRGLRSKLRHRVADRQDLEENEGDSSELDEIKKDISAIRTEIHQALNMEDGLVTDLAKIADAHFPELMKIHPELGIDIHLEFNGLVKPSQEIEHFDLTQEEGVTQGLYVSTFQGKPIFIREHLLSDGDRLDKDECVRHAISYSAAKQENLQSIMSIFFDKNARHAYVCTAKNGERLSSMVHKGKKPHRRTIQMIMRCLAKALQCLHANNIVHGEVTPQNILIREEDGMAELMHPDFSQTMKERSRKKYSTPSGISFMAPELKNAMLKDVFPATDMFNLGLLLLWLHYPDVHFSIKADAPDFTGMPLEKPVQILLSSLLNNLPHLRVTADLLMTSEYLNMTIPEVDPESQQQQHHNHHQQQQQQQQQQQRVFQDQHLAPMQSSECDVMSNIGSFDPSTLDLGEPDQETTSQSLWVPDQNQFDPVETTESHCEPDLSSETLLSNGKEANSTAEASNQTEAVSSNCDQSVSVECIKNMDTKEVMDAMEDKEREAVEDGNTEVEGVVKAESVDKPENKQNSNSSEGSPGLVEIMTGRASPLTNTDSINLEDVVKGFSKQKSFLREETRTTPPLSQLLKQYHSQPSTETTSHP
ncbi:serine/threonine-protein kinase 31-like [Haliotis asinina]|uniref:serine/threonine-protein kinase 31-like n=1 Tax=Haliotis asinina TaxID=109174 RepID=UPI003531BA14